MSNSQTNMITVYRSPERYDDYHRDYIEISSRAPISLMPMRDDCNPPYMERIASIRLQRYRASLHVSYDTLHVFGFDRMSTRIDNNQNAQAILLTVFRPVSLETDRMLREEERGHPEHTIILDKVDVIIQPRTDRLLVDVVFYACQHRDVELGQQYFQENLYRLIANSQRFGQTFIQQVGADTRTTQEIFERSIEELRRLSFTSFSYTATGAVGPRYNKKAEERALKLLESMLKPHEFKIYKESGYVIVRGKSKKMYKVNKIGMIDVSQKSKHPFYKTYRLCIEPKHYGTICLTDQVIAKIKLIQADEDKLHKIAKRFEDK